MDVIVSAEWLLGEIGSNGEKGAALRVIDASAFLPDMKRDARAEYEAGHIPGAVFLDLHEVVDSSSSLPFTLPSAETFASHVQALGIDNAARLIIYDNSPLKSAARAWWMFRIFGAKHVAVLDGGLAAWKAAGGALEQGSSRCDACRFVADYDATDVRDLVAMKDNLRTGAAQVIDARSAERFTGSTPESRPGLRSGHIPGACNMPHSSLYDAAGRLKDDASLRQLFAAAGIDLERPIITTCGSGMTASSLVLAATKLGAKHVALYDGSWTEWGGQPDTPVATGA